MKGYDEWKMFGYEDEPEREEGCTCKGDRPAKNCPLHGQNPDEAYDRMRDEGIGE